MKTETRNQILENAPEGATATHVIDYRKNLSAYIKFMGSRNRIYIFDDGEWGLMNMDFLTSSIHSLILLRELQEKDQEIAALKLRLSPSKVLNRIVELEGYNLSLANESFKHQARIDELEESNTELQAYTFRVIAFVTRAVEKLRGVPEFKPTGDVLNRVLRSTPKISLEAHNLTQQAKGVSDAVRYEPPVKDCRAISTMRLSARASNLLNQAKEL